MCVLLYLSVLTIRQHAKAHTKRTRDGGSSGARRRSAGHRRGHPRYHPQTRRRTFQRHRRLTRCSAVALGAVLARVDVIKQQQKTATCTRRQPSVVSATRSLPTAAAPISVEVLDPPPPPPATWKNSAFPSRPFETHFDTFVKVTCFDVKFRTDGSDGVPYERRLC